MTTKTRLTYTEGTSAKFWEIELRGAELHIAWGKLGTAGQSQVKALPSAEAAHKEAQKLVAEKRKKGYALEAAPAPGAAEPSAAPVSAPVAKDPAPKKAKAKAAKVEAPARPLWGALRAIDGTITVAFEPCFDEVRGGFRADGLCAVRRGDRWGFVDRAGQTRIPFDYDDAWWFEGGYACVRRAGADVFAVDTRGGEHAAYPLRVAGDVSIVIERPQRNRQDFQVQGRTRLVAADGRVIAESGDPFGPITEVAPGWFHVPGSYGLGVPWRTIDRTGATIPGLEGKSIGAFVDGRARLFGTPVRFVRMDGSELPGAWEEAKDFAEGFASVYAGHRRAGFIDAEGRVLGALDYLETFSFSDGVARVRRADGQVGLVDRTGALRVPAVHKVMRPQAHGRVAGERASGGWMLYDTETGREVLDAPYDDIQGLGADPIYAVRRGKKWGVIDRDGRSLVALDHDGITAMGLGFVGVNRGANAKGMGGLWGVADLTGRLHVAPRYLAVGLVRDGGALVQDPPADESESWPFRFYGVNPAHWAEGANMGHAWRARFTSTPWGEARDRIALAIEGAIAKGGVFGEIDWDGGFALVRAGEKKAGARKLFAAVRKAFEAAHAVVPLAEVVFLGAQVGSVDDGQGADAWERWSIRRQPEADEGPDFGLEGFLFPLASSR